ncbi:methyl-accepting chemotaxis protein [Methylocaldum sp.]|uniref:methyl-accepting chemotaxis protein n=1 Tax=Methylocaldum sp. TaxID=1969727 RepID=UPI002D3EE6C7|nr:methyl-accepting chemotaxis protein [Methylocaldum sp.]HYE37422.1 methyl-accepting chemotaxis protein [Methylocaldum sp.]
MYNVLRPAIVLMSHLRFPYKFLFIGLILALPLAVYLYLLVVEMSAGSEFARKERSGVEYLKTLQPLLRYFPKHRGMVHAALNGDSSFDGDIRALRAGIEHAMTAVDEIDNRLDSTLHTTIKWDAIKQEWNRLANQSSGVESKENFAAHTSLIANLQGLISHVGETSNLILDPALDSAYLVDAAILKLPALIENLGQARGLGTGIAARQAIDHDEKSRLIMLNTLSLENHGAVERGMDVVFQTNSSIKPALTESLRESLAYLKAFLDLQWNELISRDRIVIPPSDHFSAGTRAIDAQITLYDAVLPTLDRLLEDRIAAFDGKVRFVGVIAVTTALLSVYLFAAFYLSVRQTVHTLVHSGQRLAAGDLTAQTEISSRDELVQVADGFNNVAREFGRFIASVVASAEELSNAAGELSGATGRVAHSANLQFEAAGSTAAAMEEMSVSISEVARHAGETERISNRARELSAQGEIVVRRTSGEMEKLADSVRQSSEMIMALGARSDEISAIVKVITDIADQTNLLALNAAIEAARAGEQGRGFAVVADEVRQLAARTRNATEEIRQTIASIQDDIHRAVGAMRTGSEQVSAGVSLAAEAAISLASIHEGALQTVQSITTIAAATHEQSVVSQDIAQHVEQIAGKADESTMVAQETSAIARHLEQLATNLKTMVHHYQI